MKNNKIEKSRWERLKMLFNIGLTVVIASGVVAFSKDRLMLLFTAESMQYFPIPHLSAILLVVMLFLIFQWIRSASAEMQMFRDHFEEFIPSLPGTSFQLVIGIAILLGILGYFSNNIIVFSAVFVCLNLFDIWGNWILTYHLRKTISEARSKAFEENGRRKGWFAIETYYLEKPQVQRSVTIMFFSFISLIFGLSAKIFPDHYLENVLISGAYCIMILNIVISEIIITIWRWKRDKAIGEVYT